MLFDDMAAGKNSAEDAKENNTPCKSCDMQVRV
jgi:hypothetical protein